MQCALWVVLFQTIASAIDLTLPPAIQDGFRIGMPGGGEVRSIGVDANGDQYLAGITSGTPFLIGTRTALGPGGGNQDLFVAKVSASGQQVLYVTQIGGSDFDELGGMVVDHKGNVFLAG